MTFYSSSSSPSPRRSCAPLSHSATAASAVVVHHLLTHVFLLLTITFTPLSPFRNSNASTLSSSSSVYLPSVSPSLLLFSWLLTLVALDPIPLAGTISTPSGTFFLPIESQLTTNFSSSLPLFLSSSLPHFLTFLTSSNLQKSGMFSRRTP